MGWRAALGLTRVRRHGGAMRTCCIPACLRRSHHQGDARPGLVSRAPGGLRPRLLASSPPRLAPLGREYISCGVVWCCESAWEMRAWCLLTWPRARVCRDETFSKTVPATSKLLTFAVFDSVTPPLVPPTALRLPPPMPSACRRQAPALGLLASSSAHAASLYLTRRSLQRATPVARACRQAD
jgi:hypothetical protein